MKAVVLFGDAESGVRSGRIIAVGEAVPESRIGERVAALTLPFVVDTARFVGNIIVKTLRRGRAAKLEVSALMHR